MVKPDVIITSPYSLDYPLWRQEMENNRDKFGKIINVLYNDFRTYNFRDFIIKNTPWATSIDAGIIKGDWRNVCINKALEKSNAEWVLFLEQDFVVEDTFWEDVLELVEGSDIAGFSEDNRFHPAFLMVKRKYINKTSKDFTAYPNLNQDHFAKFSTELKKQGLKLYDLRKRYDWKHFAGISSNYMLVQADYKPNYKPSEFIMYVKEATLAEVTQDDRFLNLSRKCLK